MPRARRWSALLRSSVLPSAPAGRCSPRAGRRPDRLDEHPGATPVARMEITSAFKRRGLLFVLSSPSGAGKSTIARLLLASDEGVAMSVSATTRPIRPGEVDGRDYHFVSDDRFTEMVADGQFLEWAHVF